LGNFLPGSVTNAKCVGSRKYGGLGMTPKAASEGSEVAFDAELGVAALVVRIRFTKEAQLVLKGLPCETPSSKNLCE
jgi:hypothetical protein